MLHTMIQADRLTRLAERIRASETYAQNQWMKGDNIFGCRISLSGHFCGTPACVFGHAVAQAHYEGFIDDEIRAVSFSHLDVQAARVPILSGQELCRDYLMLDKSTSGYVSRSTPMSSDFYAHRDFETDPDAEFTVSVDMSAAMLLYLRDTFVSNPWTIHPEHDECGEDGVADESIYFPA